MSEAENNAGIAAAQQPPEMPLYQSHKKVRALEIAKIRYAYSDLVLEFAEPGHAPKLVRGKVFARYTPVPGDFYVVYDDGYESVSPRQPFLDGYTRLDPPDGAMPGQPEFKEVKP